MTDDVKYGFEYYQTPHNTTTLLPRYRHSGWYASEAERDVALDRVQRTSNVTKTILQTRTVSTVIIDTEVIEEAHPEREAEARIYAAPSDTLFIGPDGEVYRRSHMGAFGIHHVNDGRAVGQAEIGGNPTFFQSLRRLVPEAE